MTDIVDKTFQLVDVKTKKLHPMTIADDFVTLFAFHHAQVERVLKGKKGTAKFTERFPIIIIWDGKNISYYKAEHGDKIKIGKHEYKIDRAVDDIYKFLPSESFVTQLVEPGFHEKIKKFDPDDFFEAVFKYFEYYFYMEAAMLYKMVALFSINQCVFDAYDSTPYLFIRSPLEECGKTNLGKSIQQMWNGIMSTNLKAHHIFRLVHGCSPTFVFDESKGWSKRVHRDERIQDMMSVINSGYQRGVPIIRFRETGGQFGNMKAEFFQTYSPKVIIATQLSIPKDTQSRCVEVQMQRAPKGDEHPDYADRWGRKKPGSKKLERLQQLEDIREMSAIFRLKYGQEIKDYAENPKWREELDHTGAFKELRNRQLEIFKPLIILCLKYKPEWTDLVSKYIHEFIEMRERTTHSPENTVLYALRKLWQLVDEESGTYWLDDEQQVSFDDTEADGQVMWVSAKMIRFVIENHGIGAIEEFGSKHVESNIGRIFSEFGFVGTKRTKHGNLRMIKTSKLADRCLNYIGIRLSEDYELSQQERIDLLQRIIRTEGEIDYDELLDLVNGKMTEEELLAALRHLRKQGTISTSSTEGKGRIMWCG